MDNRIKGPFYSGDEIDKIILLYDRKNRILKNQNYMIEDIALSELTNYIISISNENGHWQISRDRILELLDLDMTDVYRQIVSSTNPLVSFSISQFTHNDAGALISLLETIGLDKAPEAFWNAGLWIPFAVQTDLQSFLIEQIWEERNNHLIEYESFLSIFDRFGNFHRSIDIYLEEYFPHGPITDRAIGKLLTSINVDPGENRIRLLRSLAYELFRREIIPYRNLFSRFIPELKNYLISKGRIEPPARPRSPVSEEEKIARRLFAYSPDQPIILKDLKDRYKNLMKKYHPDINPEGLEKSKEINRAYCQLLPGK
ncbi:J domain-containing protein [Spirochaeta isovalerica]|uniref:J domain-containing protein n=1 Tax=Spirochaeta isovalerica TaxID=150 RepID=A0A841RDD9_9SPIO|nr:J domain-containing protein [Spirochaeta isovalerica]MBB6480402.1 hypothetical protein [Spirochaeta isovalerica]